ncbi:hypothetical protein GGR88_000726 [Sphingomonas jejuensis]|uniref:Uncharacterized protein n=1 Tax=Sphingomonas jejuensis TaxID=904715 RepID=A0ABX0XIT8_9SPHN|nr:hypothetical protein [Sphingomonas jejuensis]NJC33252.1 hypothetical protein [Sphingomonas jejuensis]
MTDDRKDDHHIIDSPDGKRRDDDRASPLDGPGIEGGTAGTGGVNKSQDEPGGGQNNG